MKVTLFIRGHEMATIEKQTLHLGDEFYVCGDVQIATYRVTLVDQSSAIAERIRLEFGHQVFTEETML